MYQKGRYEYLLPKINSTCYPRKDIKHYTKLTQKALFTSRYPESEKSYSHRQEEKKLCSQTGHKILKPQTELTERQRHG